MDDLNTDAIWKSAKEKAHWYAMFMYPPEQEALRKQCECQMAAIYYDQMANPTPNYANMRKPA